MAEQNRVNMHLTYLKSTLFSLLIFALFWAGTSKFGGSPGGKTASPADGSNCTACHSGSDVINKNNWISTNIPENGYIPGNTYEIKIDAYHKGSVRIGFEITSETANIKTGVWALSDTVKTQFANNSTAITHTYKGTVATDSVHWKMKWTAPDATNGNVTFYAAVNATNSDSGSSGDQVYLISKTIKEEGTSSVAKRSKFNDIGSIWPNPATDYLNISIKDDTKIELLEIINLQGTSLKKLYRLDKNLKIALKDIPEGVLFVKIQIADKIYVQPFIKY